MVQGKNFTISIKEEGSDNLQRICFATSWSISFNNEMLETVPPFESSGKNKTYVYGMGGYKINISTLLDLGQFNLFNAAAQQKTLYWKGTTEKDGGLAYSGVILIDSSEMSGDASGFATSQTSFTGSGDLLIEEMGFIRAIYLMNEKGSRTEIAYPARVFSVHGELIGTAKNLNEFIFFWSLDYYNAMLGTLVVSNGEFILQAKFSATDIPNFIQTRQNGDPVYVEDGRGNNLTDGQGNLLVLN